MSKHQANSLDALHEIVSTFKLFEKKIDKLQNDVNYHGQTLTELRVMVANLSGGMINDLKMDNLKGVSKITAMDSFNFNEPIKTKRKHALQPLLPRVATKNVQAQKYGIKPSRNTPNDQFKIMPNKSNNIGSKRIIRQRKGDAPRKATTLQSKKGSGKKRNKSPQKRYEFQSLV